MKFNIPKEAMEAIEKLQNAGFEAFLVGGCVRDLLLGREPKDWDITTNATPEQIISTFEKTYYENNFGTVGVVNENPSSESLKVIEITPYRVESSYSDFRRPDSVTFSTKIEDDLKRRDFTINAMAFNPIKGQLIDLYKGQEDIDSRLIRTVGNPEDRFSEDALRMMRAVRLAAELGFMINIETQNAIQFCSNLLEKISKERIRDEFTKILMSKYPMDALVVCHNLGILKHVIPELEHGIGVEQGKSHVYDVWEHSLRALQHGADKDWSLEVRLAALLHDIGKPPTRRLDKEKNEWTFYGHEVIGERIAVRILKNLKFPKNIEENVLKLIRWHMFFSDTEQITLSAVRRLINHTGKENIWKLMEVRACDRKGMGRPKEEPYRLRKYKSMIEEAMRAPLSVGMLKIDGKKVMEVTEMKPGPKIGQILNALLEEVLDDPKLNEEEYLESEAKKLSKLSDEELRKIGEKAKEKKETEEEKELEEIRKKYSVR
jgi:putative nucleotidyltransferase with HDIG domain